MITSRLLILQIVVALGLGTFFLLPEPPESQPSGVNMELPEYLGEWWGQNADVTEKERGILGPDTTFSRKLYTNGRGDEIFVSVVLSGQDMSKSIHRPERCLPAQGWTMLDSKRVAVQLQDAEKHTLQTTRLHNVRPWHSPDGTKTVKVYNVTYYWFAGLTDTTASHFTRMFYDNRDRLFKGYNQRWAYITLAATITDGLKPFGRTEKEVDATVQEFIQQITPVVHGPSIRY